MTTKTELKKLLKANDGLMFEFEDENFEISQGCICNRAIDEEDGFVYEHVWEEISNPDYMEESEIVKWLEVVKSNNRS